MIEPWGEQGWAHPLLSKREREVLDIFVQEGASNREIALAMHLSEKTVKQYVANAMWKLGANNRTHLALIVCRQERV